MKDNYCPCTIGLAVLNYWRKYRTRPEAGLYKSLHLAIPDGRAWSKLGEHGEHGEHGKNGKHQPDYVKKHSILRLYGDG